MKIYTLPHPIIESTFNVLRQSQIKDKEELIDLLCKINLLPSELWIYIVSFINDDDLYKAYFMFERKDICMQYTYYFFHGTKSNFDESMSKLQKEALILQDKINENLDEYEDIDTPIDTYCIYDIHEAMPEYDFEKCCINTVNKCCSNWKYYVYDTSEELYTDYKDINKNGLGKPYYKVCKVVFI